MSPTLPIDRVAVRKAGNIEGWEPFYYERISDAGDVLVKGCVPRILTRGPNKGAKTARGCDVVSVVVTSEECKAEEATFS